MDIQRPVVDTLLQGYRLGTNHGELAFCGVNLVEGLDEAGVLRRIVVDTGHTGRRRVLEAALAERGLTASDIDIVVCTHAHWDHIENLNMFGRAQIVLHRNERRYITKPHHNDFACPEWIDGIFERYQERLREVEEGVSLIPGVEIVDAPGHSAGTLAVTAVTDDGVAVIAGDSIQNATVAVERRNNLVFWNDEEATRTIDKLVTISDAIYPGHDQAFRIGADNSVDYIQEFELELTHLSPSQPGLVFDPSMDLDHYVMPGIEEQSYPD